MDKPSKRTLVWLTIVLLLVISFGIVKKFSRQDPVGGFDKEDLKCIIDLGRYDDTTKGLISGYNYALLKRFAEDIESNIDIRDGREDENWLDSLEKEVVDIIVVPIDTITVMDNIDSSIPVDSLTRWFIKSGDPVKIAEINSWIESYLSSDEYEYMHNIFLKTYSPLISARAGVRKSELSPYDNLIRQYADTLGWDWRLLAAVIYQESRFRINANSYKGAEGLMQMIRTTADRYEIDNLFDPEESIKGGALHLRRLQNMFWRYAATAYDRRLFALAGYNAGEGHIKRCIKYADSLGVQITTWEELEAFMPLFDFKWGETLTYISRIDSCYQAFMEIYEPSERELAFTQNGLSEQDQPGK